MILLDTHVLIWIVTDERKISRAARAAIRRARSSGGFAISAISLVEIATLIGRGKLEIQSTAESIINRFTTDIRVIPISREIAALTIYFPQGFPHDPADRIIAATARAENLLLVTADQRLLECPLVKTIW